jgi:hypothetical protein
MITMTASLVFANKLHRSLRLKSNELLCRIISTRYISIGLWLRTAGQTDTSFNSYIDISATTALPYSIDLSRLAEPELAGIAEQATKNNGEKKSQLSIHIPTSTIPMTITLVRESQTLIDGLKMTEAQTLKIG